MRKRVSQAELVESHAPHIAPLLVYAAITALTSAYGAKKQADAQRNSTSADAVGHGQMGAGGFTPSADRFRVRGVAPTGNSQTDQALRVLLGAGVTGNAAADNAIMQPIQPPAAAAPDSVATPNYSDIAKDQETAALGTAAGPNYSDFAANQESQALGTASADPSVADAAASALSGGGGGFDLGSLMPYVQMAAQVGGAISEANRPQPVALHVGRMGGYNSTVPDSVERLRQMLAQMQRGRR